jgi:hypothetical protein
MLKSWFVNLWLISLLREGAVANEVKGVKGSGFVARLGVENLALFLVLFQCLICFLGLASAEFYMLFVKGKLLGKS